MRALLLPPVTGTYTFWLATDDGGALYLSTDEGPARKVQIASESSWAGQRAWNEHASQKSVPVQLRNGFRYYIEALQTEGAGGDNLAVAWQKPGDAAVANGAPPIPGTYLVPYGVGPPVITVQPANQAVVEGAAAVFSIQLAQKFGASYQWYRIDEHGMRRRHAGELPMQFLGSVDIADRGIDPVVERAVENGGAAPCAGELVTDRFLGGHDPRHVEVGRENAHISAEDVEEQPVSFSRRAQSRPLEMLTALLANGGRGVFEETLSSILWPEADGDAAHQAFDTNLFRLRRLLGNERALTLSDAKLSLNPAVCWVDAWACERLFGRLDTLLRAPGPNTPTISHVSAGGWA